jgi:RNA recognition motif-containing protein
LEKAVTIYVGNLSFQATEEDLREVFADYGEVKRISLPVDRETGRKRGFAFVEMSDEAQEDSAIAALDGAEWLGRELRVNKARPAVIVGHAAAAVAAATSPVILSRGRRPLKLGCCHQMPQRSKP